MVTRVKKDPAKLLIAAIFEKLGGVKHIGEELDAPRQTPDYWQRFGRVPLNRLAEVSKKFKVNPWALNYAGLKEILGAKNSPSFKEVVKECELDPFVEKQIIALSSSE